ENYKIKMKDTTILVSCSPYFNSDKTQGSIITLQDISSLNIIAEELEAVKHLNLELNSIINNSYDGIWVLDGEGKTLKVNKTYEQFSGIPIEDLLDRNIKDLVNEGYFTDSAAMHVLKEKKPHT